MRSLIEGLARAGYAARGLVFAIIGLFAVLAALGRSDTTDSEGALLTLLSQPFGTILVWAMIVGLLGHAVWRLVQAVFDPDRHGSAAKGLAIRLGLIGSGLGYSVLAFFAASLVIGGRAGGGDPSGRWLAAAYEAGFGALVVWGIAAVLLVVAGALIFKGARARFDRYIDCPERVMRWFRPVAQFGLIARGVVFLILAVLIATGGIAYRPENRPGLKEALEAVQGLPLGWLLLLVIGLGLLGFAVYSFLEARFRTVKPP